MSRILVIRLGALGDLVFCFQAFAAIRAAHPDAEIALLTRAPFAEFARKMPWFDRVIIEKHPGALALGGWLSLLRDITTFAPTRVYDLQGKRRQNILYALLGGPWGPQWSGAAPGCTFPRPWPPKPDQHFTDFLAAQLNAAGVASAVPFDTAWLDAPVGRLSLPERFAALVPGCSPDAPHKRWPPQKYAELAGKMQALGLHCVAVGTKEDGEAVAAIKKAAPDVIDLSGQTSLLELAGILRRAAGVVGNDTGPVHMAAAVGTPTLALFSGRSNPVWSKPPGPLVAWRQSDDLANLRVDEVFFAFGRLLQHAKGKRS